MKMKKLKTKMVNPGHNKTLGIGIEIKSPFHNNDKPIDKLVEKQSVNSLFKSQNITPDDDYCTCERCPHCGKKIRKTQPMWSVSF